LGYIAEWSFTGVLRPGDEKRLTHVNFAFALGTEGRGSNLPNIWKMKKSSR